MALVHEVDSGGLADVRVCEVASRGAADLLVCRAESRSAARDDGVWCFVGSRADATSLIHFTDSRGTADLLVCFVDSRGAAGWRRDHPLKGRL